MKNYIIVGLVLCLVVALSGCIWQGTGSGNLINQSQNVQGFNQISLNGQGNLIITQGSSDSLTIEAEDNIVPKIKTSVNDNKLSISFDPNTPVATKPINFYVTVKDLNLLEIAGAGQIQTNSLNTQSLTININGSGNGNLGGLNLEKLIVKINGAGKMNMSGTAREQTIIIAGAGDYSASGLQSYTASVTINGSGKAALNVVDVLNAIINGAGEVSYTGSPQVNQQINGGGSVKKT
ncbi:MAG: DUF2807 domain-containing protein [Methanobacteriaceae archaeon]|nr:DUF2807 domain-containing protein [Methanobacteriaceae archaeon]